eukprot:TRINITY_DN664_c0_g1_i6.p1 TRINITY_DN664_c0_g1~~TRINITY_DN664_c0_g1_i6.p1  ORF type:complete len:1569 (-),score=306.79 TRINITY_DN664_c0_g1_i6:3-4382(-)
MMVSMLGVMRAGKAYCPIEPDYPTSRVHAMIDTACITHALAPKQQVPQEVLDDVIKHRLHNDDKGNAHPVLQAFAVADNGCVYDYHDTSALAPSDKSRVPVVVTDDSPAYVLFTSGSTGKPKGCSVPHRGSALYGLAVAKACHLDSDMIFLLKTPYVFDVHIQDIYSAFAVGSTLVLADPGSHRDASAIADTIADERINVACFVPTLLVEFVNHLRSRPEDAAKVKLHLRRVLCIGEALMTATCKELFDLIPEVEIHNLYGPTEASVGVSHFQVTPASIGASPVAPIGKPFGYTSFRVMDHTKYDDKTIESALLVDVPDGEIGELFIGGDCLSHGYINDPTRTAAAFFHYPDVQQRPPNAASRFGLYKTGDLVRRRPQDGAFEYLGRCDFQVKIGGVRIECEEVSSVLKTHPAVQDALVCAFDGPFGKALAAYVVADKDTNWQLPIGFGSSPHAGDGNSNDNEDDDSGDKDLVSKWGAVYDEMYQDHGEGISEGDPTLNWSGYVDTYSRRTHVEHVIKEWVEWSCELVLRHQDTCFPSGKCIGDVSKQSVVELGCGNGMLLFRIAPVVAKSIGGQYVATDISTSGLSYVTDIIARGPPYGDLPVKTHKIAAHEVLTVCEPCSTQVVLCNGVTMYFPSTEYLLECMQTAVKATVDGGFSIIGDIQSKRHLTAFHADVQTFQALRRPDATPLAVLRAARKAAASEQLSYFDDNLFARLERAGMEMFDGRVARFEMRLKRGWWHSEFNRFRYDIEIVVGKPKTAPRQLSFQRHGYAAVSAFLGKPCDDMVALECKDIESFVKAQVDKVAANIDGIVVTLPNARMLRPVRLLAWLEDAEKNGQTLEDMPSWLWPKDIELGGSKDPNLAKFGIEPEALFEMQLPNGWTQKVIWAEDPAMLDLVILKDTVSDLPWLSSIRDCKADPLTEEELRSYKNCQMDYQDSPAADFQKGCHDALRAWAAGTSLLPAMRPLVYVGLEEFPKNQAGKTDRGKLPDARAVLDKVSDAAVLAFEEPRTDDEKAMARLWEDVLKVTVSASTPFLAYGANSLVALNLCGRVLNFFGKRPDLAFLMSEDCTVRALVRKLRADEGSQSNDKQSCIIRLSPENRTGIHLLIFGAAGTSAITYQPMVEHFDAMQVFAVEMPGRGSRSSEELANDFYKLRESLQEEVGRWAVGKKFIVWGDSLGSVLAYEIIAHMADKESKGILGFCVSGNSGPTVAAHERGMGEAVAEYLGRDVNSVSDMTDKDWDQFFLAANSADADQLRELLADTNIRRQAMEPLIADCTAYESYSKCEGRLLRCPLLTVRGQKDQITAGGAMESWGIIGGGRVEHKVISGVGHMIVREAPRRLAKVIENAFLPDFTSHLNEYQTFRTAYQRLRREPARSLKCQDGAKVAMHKDYNFSPTLGATAVPKDLDHSVLEFDLSILEHSEQITPSTKQNKLMRAGNMQWRMGEAQGNKRRSPL